MCSWLFGDLFGFPGTFLDIPVSQGLFHCMIHFGLIQAATLGRIVRRNHLVRDLRQTPQTCINPGGMTRSFSEETASKDQGMLT